MIELRDRHSTGPTVRLHDKDNIVIARVDVGLGMSLPEEGITSRSQVGAGHKIASQKITKGDPIRKYGVTIGFAATDIEPGTLIHSHNLEFRETVRDYAYARDFKPIAMVPEAERASFMGIVRDNGRWRHAITSASSPPLIARPRSCTRSPSGSRPSASLLIRTSMVSRRLRTASAAAWR